jgi:hypothetical protein
MVHVGQGDAMYWTRITHGGEELPPVQLLGRSRCHRIARRVEAYKVRRTSGPADNGFEIDGEFRRAIAGCHADGTAIPCPAEGCTRWIVLKPVRGTFNPDKACNARCMGATGPSCECACGGANHGGNHG